MAARKRNPGVSSATKILAIDVGGTGIKAAVIDTKGRFLSKRLRMKTPHHCKPAKMVSLLVDLVAPLKGYDHISIGFPGYVRDGKVFTAPNLGTKAWAGFHLAKALERKLGKPTRLNNDADVQGLAVISGKGLELVCTLGTGFGTAWFRDGELMPHMDLAHLTFHKKDDFDVLLGDRTRKQIKRGLEDASDQIKNTAEDFSEKAEQYGKQAERAIRRGREVVDDTLSKAGSVASKVSGFI